jgi:hypothetical protein
MQQGPTFLNLTRCETRPFKSEYLAMAMFLASTRLAATPERENVDLNDEMSGGNVPSCSLRSSRALSSSRFRRFARSISSLKEISCSRGAGMNAKDRSSSLDARVDLLLQSRAGLS